MRKSACLDFYSMLLWPCSPQMKVCTGITFTEVIHDIKNRLQIRN